MGDETKSEAQPEAVMQRVREYLKFNGETTAAPSSEIPKKLPEKDVITRSKEALAFGVNLEEYPSFRRDSNPLHAALKGGPITDSLKDPVERAREALTFGIDPEKYPSLKKTGHPNIAGGESVTHAETSLIPTPSNVVKGPGQSSKR